MLRHIFFMEKEITCSVRQDLSLWSKNIKLDLSTIVSMSFSTKLMLKDWNYRTHNTVILNLEENKLDYKKNYQWKKNFSEKLQYEIFMNWVRWRELKNYELTNSQYRNLRASHDTIQRLTSQLQSMQEQMNSMSDSGEFQVVESNHSGRLSHVPSQPAGIPSPRSMLRQTLATWNMACIWTTGKRGQGDGVPRHAFNRRRRTREGPEPACVETSFLWSGTCRRGRAN